MTIDCILDAIRAEIIRQGNLGNTSLDSTNTKNDWIAYICAYAGRASDKTLRNQREGQDFENNLIKVAALCVSAIKAQHV